MQWWIVRTRVACNFVKVQLFLFIPNDHCNFYLGGTEEDINWCFVFKKHCDMDDSAHRENGRHKSEYYKGVHGQVSLWCYLHISCM